MTLTAADDAHVDAAEDRVVVVSLFESIKRYDTAVISCQAAGHDLESWVAAVVTSIKRLRDAAWTDVSSKCVELVVDDLKAIVPRIPNRGQITDPAQQTKQC